MIIRAFVVALESGDGLSVKPGHNNEEAKSHGRNSEPNILFQGENETFQGAQTFP